MSENLNKEVERILEDLSKREGDWDKINDNNVKNFLEMIPLRVAIEWGIRLDEFNSWKMILSRKDITCARALVCIKIKHSTAVLALVLERKDVVDYFFKHDFHKVLNFVRKVPYWQIWEIFVQREDVSIEQALSYAKEHEDSVNNYGNIWVREAIEKKKDKLV